MSANIETASVASVSTEPRQFVRVGVWTAFVFVAGLGVAGIIGAMDLNAADRGCVARVGCVSDAARSEASFSATGVSGVPATWMWWAQEPVSPALEHYRYQAVEDQFASSAFEPVSPALEHFKHSPSRDPAFEPVSPALEHFLHAPSADR